MSMRVWSFTSFGRIPDSRRTPARRLFHQLKVVIDTTVLISRSRTFEMQVEYH